MADNRDRWASWTPAFTTTLGPDRPQTIVARGYLAYWRGRSGDVAGAITDYEALLADYNRVLGFHRWIEGSGQDVIVVGSRGESTRWGYELSFPIPGFWREVFNSDDARYGGDGVTGTEPVQSTDGRLTLRVPARAVMVLRRSAG